MATINYDFYDEKDVYTDGDIEDKIIEFIKRYPDDYEKAFEENPSWPVVYHLSNARKNIISWYPFKENASILEVGAGMGAITDELCKIAKSVTSIELSKKRASAIYERNKKKENLEIIVGNYNKIKFDKKYDYILLNGVLEYGSLYIESNNPYIDFINSLKSHLSENGKILIAIENKFGLKYWCGADEDHTARMFEGIKNYPNDIGIKTFSKNELENIAKECGLISYFYYVFPDYKFPELIYTDASLKKKVFNNYLPYYCSYMSLITYEQLLYKEIFKNNEIPFFANSYFIELSEKQESPEIEFVKFNNYRAKQYNLCTYLSRNKYYKKPLYDVSKYQIDNILKIQDIYLKNKIDIQKTFIQNNRIYTEEVKGISLISKLNHLYRMKDYDEIVKIFDELFEYLKKHSGILSRAKENIFDKLKINTKKYDLSKLNFYIDGLIDIIPQNIFINEDKYVIIDQEWYEENVPIEFIMYRAIINFTCGIYNDIYDILINHYKIRKYIKLFDKLESKLFANVYNKTHQIMSTNYYFNYRIINNFDIIKTDYDVDYINKQNMQIDKLNNEIVKLENDIINERANMQINYNKLSNDKIKLENDIVIERANMQNNYNKLENNYNELQNKHNAIINSKGWIFLEKLRRIKKIFKK